MVTQLAFPVGADEVDGLHRQIQRLASEWTSRTGAVVHVDVAARAAARRFEGWGKRPLTRNERRRVEAYFRAVLRRRILAGSDRSARDARGRLVALSIEEDLVRAGWDRTSAAQEAKTAAGLPASA